MPANMNGEDPDVQILYESDNVRNGIRGTTRVELHRRPRETSIIRIVQGLVIDGELVPYREDCWVEAEELLNIANALKDVLGR